MSYRHTIVTAFIYSEDAECIANNVREQLGATVDIARSTDGRAAYVHGWFKTLSDSGLADILAELDLPIDCVVMFENGTVLARRASRTASPPSQITG